MKLPITLLLLIAAGRVQVTGAPYSKLHKLLLAQLQYSYLVRNMEVQCTRRQETSELELNRIKIINNKQFV